MKRSQIQAARAVARVLAGESLSAALLAVGANDAGPARAFVHELTYGTLRHHGTLEALVRTLATKRITDAQLVALIEVALYQLEFARSPPFAVVDQAVAAAAELARPAAKALVNALLRRFLRDRDALVDDIRAQPQARWSHPAWWINRVGREFPDDWEAILEAGNQRPPLTLRSNRRVGSPEALLQRLADRGIEARAAGVSGIIVDAPRPVTELPGFAEGAFAVQDLGAQLAAPILDLRDGMRVLDACAAPGGKTTHMLELANIDLVALDSDEARLPRVRENVSRLAPEARIDIVAGDAAATDWWDGVAFQRILADLPCTSSGVVRRHPDGKWLRRESDIEAFAARQRAIADACWRMLADGGLLLYATCSVFRDENDANVERFVAAHPDALREPITFADEVAHSGGQLLPSLSGAVHNQDGFFYSLLRKT
ncbi:MAG TPA: 16S rRNA (cytosine(967)-C(5))-methyltransferase RsmB [Casimicrobiaceae bacterium]|nr:16S rRNA (cytosine(967)-C(5))-methyltransferase RsmB [Casimicrobiaceae bacterium]